MSNSYAYAPIELKSDEDDENGIVTKALENLTTSVSEKLSAFEKKSNERLDAFEARWNRPANDNNRHANDNEAGALERKAYETYLRRGAERLGAEEIKAMTVAVDANGGYLAPEEFAKEILKKLVEYSPIRQYARVVQIATSEVKIPRRLTGTAATWVGEVDDRTTSAPTFEQVLIAPFELATYTDISTQLLEDNSYGLESELALDFAESFGKTEGTAYVKGSGVGQPKGLMTATGITEVKTGVAADFPASNPADVLVGMYHVLPTLHAQNGVWLMNRTTLGKMRTWKDTTGRYLVIDPISEGAPATLLGRPIVEAIDMDDIGANKYPVAFGDLQGFRIVDRVGLTTMRDPFTLATKGQVRFHARRRTGSEVTNPDRFVKLKCSA
ncbi:MULTISPECIES: phage major capsid protein [unclassified Beijerinckia]|uniref:phage major capsid protein n=1 Tax=unclassified Beijerinckia TaxID=2638183 RepID=UPI00089D5E17|nr:MULTISPECIES: phage major capsid protein [unclassified Beijerinckia]MDH7795793.1 HK97 family phage major capsid protein [Beijerinckia sp. GAS462]SEC16631.1 phage major capsid protein, HK97 family [Beijerinckia sp. 28-YEA-48]